MTVRLQLVLDQLVSPTDSDLEMASRELSRQLIDSAPSDCVVDAVYPAEDAPALTGIARERRLRLPRRELAAAWQFGLAPGLRGIVHSPTLMAPLVRHDRTNDNDQTVVTVWDLRAWDAPEAISRGNGGWQRAMLRRAARHADAIVVPTHAMADRLRELVRSGERVRVVAGAAPEGFAVPSDETARRRDLGLPERYVAVSAVPRDEEALTAAFRAIGVAGADAVVFDAREGTEPQLTDRAAAAGLAERRVHVHGPLDRGDRAVVLQSAAAFIAGSTHPVWPWRVVEAMALGTPIVAADSPVHREVVLDGGVLVPQNDLPDALAVAFGPSAQRLTVLSRDRGRAFSWRESADRVWQLHADL